MHSSVHYIISKIGTNAIDTEFDTMHSLTKKDRSLVKKSCGIMKLTKQLQSKCLAKVWLVFSVM